MVVSERARWVLDLGDTLLYIASKYGDLLDVEAWNKIRGICDEGIGHYESEDHANPFLAQRLMQLATQIAERQEDTSAAWNYQLRIAESFYDLSRQREMDGGTTGGKLVAYKFMEDAMHYYQRLVSLAPSSTERDRLRSRVEDARREVRRLLREGEAEMKPIGTSVDIPRETLEQMVAPLLEVEPEDVLELLSGDRSWLPDIADIQHRAKEAAGKYVYSTLFGRVTLRDGRKVDEIPAMQGETVHFFDYLNSWFQFHAQILNFILHRLKEEGRFSLETFMAHLRRWEFLEEPDATFIEVGLERYFTGDHISAIHVLTPRIEHMLKSAFEQAGIVPIVVPDQRHIREQTFGDFLRRDEVRQVLGEDLWHYLNYACF
jgi:hypothetical protein